MSARTYLRIRTQHDGLVHVVHDWRVKKTVGIARCHLGFRVHERLGYEWYYEAKTTTAAPTCMECASYI